MNGSRSDDAELISTHAAFMAAHRRIHGGNGGADLPDDESTEGINRWYAALDRATALSPVTAEGRRLKVEIAHAALTTCIESYQREEMCALSVLACLLADGAVA